ncbi:F-box only protein 16 [Prinia subflava]|uniref:F-box only protein 16 n=1 Tax=Prinia subflava TaxID=208062 RepID=UPI002FE2E2DB
MAFAPPKIPPGPGLQLKLSSWTPLNHAPTNDKVFEERRALLGKWFDKWTDGQRRRILVDLLERCSLSQQKFCCRQLQARVPAEAVDFTTTLPRVLTLYIFSFLDPRSLCRCAQVSWHWKHLSELDRLWMPKCLRLGWVIAFRPTPLEQGVWKQHYVETVRELRLTTHKIPAKDEFIVVDVQPVKSDDPERKLPVAGQGMSRARAEPPPWRSADRNPTDTVRYNYLDNCDPIEQARQAQFSLPADPEPIPRPPLRPWVSPQHPGVPLSKAAIEARARSSLWNAGIRPGPIRAPKPRPRGPGDVTGADTGSPSSPPFEAQPWRIPSSDQGSDTE